MAMRFFPAMIATLAMCLLSTGFTIAASPNLKGDPELDGSYKQMNIVKQVHLPSNLGMENEIHGHDLEPDPFDELDQHVAKMVKHLDVSSRIFYS